MAPSDSAPSRESIDACTKAVFAPMALRAALQLEIFTKLAKGPMTSVELGQALGVEVRRLEMLLYQLVLSNFIELEGTKFSNSEVSDHYLVVGRRGYIGSIHGLWTENWTSMLQMAEGVRTNRAQAKLDFDAMSPEDLGGFIRGLHGTTISAGRALATRTDFSKVHRVADIGGGSGGLSIGLCEEHPHLSATVFELPSLVPIAREIIAEAGLADRIDVETADILTAPIAGEFDVTIAKAVFQVMSEENARTAMRTISAAIPRGGTFHVIGFVCDESRLAPELCVGVNLVFINMFDDGQAYTESQYRDWLSETGFTDIVRQPFPFPPGSSLMTARKI